MERNFTNENFDQFLKQNADGLRMLPSDKVWKGISKHFRQRRRKFGLLLGIGLFISTGTGYYFVERSANGPAQPAIPGSSASTVHPGSQKAGNSVTGQVNQDFIRLDEKKEVHAEVVGKGKLKGPATLLGQSSFLLTDIKSANTNDNTLVADEVQNNFVSTVVDDSYPLNESLPAKKTAVHKTATDPLTIESVMNSYVARKKSKLSMQVYFTPNISYRKLSENKDCIKHESPSSIPATQMSLYDINSFVTHKPDFGFELGLAAKYPVSKNVKLRAGVQFNVNRYDIKVFNSTTQVATIRLNNGSDSLSQPTNYSNTNGYKSNWLENFYFQISAPVGVEFKISGDDDVQFGVASTIQPTYVLGDRAYLISTDYKNYAEVPWLIRRWNVNTSLETFVSYSTGQLHWQVGPQVRYQLLSSFVKKYPVKENLFDFGLKVGVSLNK